MPRLKKRRLERVQYWQGQTLRARDFLDLQAVEAQRRWWHNRAVHNAYGVAEGLKSLPNSALSEATGIIVSPGVSYDISGRELILERQQYVALPVNLPPDQVVTWSLLMRYKPPQRRMRPDEIGEVCFNSPGSVVAGTAEFVWKAGDRIDPAEGVSIVAVRFSKGRLLGRDPSFIQPAPVPVARPLLAAGATVPGSTPWTPWTVVFAQAQGESSGPATMGVQTWIDTSAAGFTQIPCYFAQLEGALWNPQSGQFVPALFQSIADESITGFMFRIWLPVRQDYVAELAPQERILEPYLFGVLAQQQKLYVSWIGCQKRASIDSCCAPQNSAAVNTVNQGIGSLLSLR